MGVRVDWLNDAGRLLLGCVSEREREGGRRKRKRGIERGREIWKEERWRKREREREEEGGG